MVCCHSRRRCQGVLLRLHRLPWLPWLRRRRCVLLLRLVALPFSCVCVWYVCASCVWVLPLAPLVHGPSFPLIRAGFLLVLVAAGVFCNVPLGAACFSPLVCGCCWGFRCSCVRYVAETITCSSVLRRADVTVSKLLCPAGSCCVSL